MTNRIEDTFTGGGATPPFVAKLIKADGTCIPVVPAKSNVFSYEELTGFVGGYIEVVQPPTKTGAVIVCNEEGKIIGLPLNRLATEMWQAHAEPGSPRLSDPVVGDVLLCHLSQIE